MQKKIFNTILILIVIVGIIICIVGFIRIVIVKKQIADGSKEIEEILSQDKNNIKNIDTIADVKIQDSNEENTNENIKGIGLLTIKTDKEYKIAIYENVTPLTLKKGVGRLSGSAQLNTKGNCILYGHRDSAFKPLWNIKVGDEVSVKSLYSEKKYLVYNIYITDPEDEKITKQTTEDKLTLVTCYPFVYSGAAKKRCIVECK